MEKISVNMKVSTVENKPKQKETKAESELTANNLDPLAYFSRFLDIPETILQHLTGKDLIKISEVSPLWYNVIAASKNLMEKIKVVLIGYSKLPKKLLKNSSRKYQNIEVPERFDNLRQAFPLTRDFEFIRKGLHDWKSASINETHFRTKLDLWKFLRSIEASVERFSIRTRMHSNPESFNREPTTKLKVLKFSKLKHLKMNFHNFPPMSEFHARLFLNMFAIETFEFVGDYCPRASYGALTKMLENFNKLTSLTLEIYKGQLFEDDSWKRFQFKLKSLSIKFEGNFGRSINFLNFLKSQSDQLEKLSFERYDDRELISIIVKMPKLKSLELKSCRIFFENEIPNEISSSITDLKLKYMLNIDSLKFLLLSMPNIRSLSICLIDEEFFELLIEMNRKFEELRVDRLVDVDENDLKKILVEWTGKALVGNENIL